MSSQASTAHSMPGMAKSALTIRHYCQGIGDCHLLRFTKNDGSDFYMLIDCGLHSSVKNCNLTMQAIADDIKSTTQRIDVLVHTHEHMDHNSGFLTANETFRQITFGEAWLGWTEDPADPQANELDKYKNSAIKALCTVDSHFAAQPSLSMYMQGVRDGVQELTQFYFGVQGQRVRAARDAAANLAEKVRYLEPGPKPITIPGLDNLRIYVLGPPRDAAMIRITDRPSEMYGMSLGRGHAMASSLLNAVANYRGQAEVGDDDNDMLDPFDRNQGESLAGVLATGQASLRGDAVANPRFTTLRSFIARRYGDAGNTGNEDWRRIDMDWAGVSADLAMQLDNRTNNTSVVLAFEFIDSGDVVLFTADAQIGSWLSWQSLRWKIGDDWTTTRDLLNRTIYCKISHHGSRNATPKTNGLEQMISPWLTTFIPTNKVDATNVGWKDMPSDDVIPPLDARTHHRIIRADDPWIATGQVPADFALQGSPIKVGKGSAVPSVNVDIH